MKLQKALIHYYYGPGAGKTSIGLGHILRAFGHELKPILLQFCKLHDPTNSSGFNYGEYITLTQQLHISVFQYGSHQFIKDPKDISPEYRQRIQEGLKKIRDIFDTNGCDLLILDELNTAIGLHLITIPEILDIFKHRPLTMEVIITGREEIPELIAIADYVTYLKEIKHPFQKKISARKGIEY
jgi:cob(I)alamin adenosyltransferase